MIIVTGATGQLGRQIVRKLIERTPASGVGASCREPDQANDLAALGVRVRHGDFEDAASLADAFEGISQLLLVSSNASARGGDPRAQHRRAIDAAKASGAKRIVYTSHMAASASSAFPPMHDHAATEAMLAECGLPWIALRNGFYASGGIDMLSEALDSGTFESTGSGPVSWTAHADLAEAAAIALLDPDHETGPTPPLTGGEALSFDDMATLATGLGRPVETRTVTADHIRAKVVARGAPAAAAAIVLGLFEASRNGEFATVDPTLERLLGRPPATVRQLLSEKLAR